MTDPGGVSVVIPTVGRPSLTATLHALGTPRTGQALEVLIVDDRRDRAAPLPVTVPAALTPYTRTVAGAGRGPAAARNTGWRAARHPWVAFLDDDVVPEPGWLDALRSDLDAADAPTDGRARRIGGVQGRLRVPLPADRRPTDWERNTAALADGEWLTADMAYRRAALSDAGGFDERLPRAFREDAELAYRVRAGGWDLLRGRRVVTHPVRPESRWVSLRTQRGNADDALLRRLYGPGWRRTLEVPPGRRRRHAAVTVAAVAALGCAAAAAVAPPGRGRGWRFAAAMAGAGWLAGTAEFAAVRIAPGPRTAAEVTTMVVTSAIIPPLAVGHWLRGWWRWRAARPMTVPGQGHRAPRPTEDDVYFSPRWAIRGRASSAAR